MPYRATGLERPPRAPIAFRVGIIGHRPNRLPAGENSLDALRSTLRYVLEQVRAAVVDFASVDDAKTLYSGDQPVLRAVSSLAEGSDRIFAEEALDLGYRLLCPMPFHQNEFEADFAPKNALESRSLERFHEILERARARGPDGLTVFELDGDRHAEGAAYAAAGRVVLNQSDLLIAVWDGGGAAGGGGTAQTLREALQFHVPVLWIHSNAPHAWRILNGIQDLQPAELDQVETANSAPLDPAATRTGMSDAIRTVVSEELVLPAPAFSPNWASIVRAHAVQYFQERKPALNIAFVWKTFRSLVVDWRLRIPQIIVGDFEAQIDSGWPINRTPEVTPSNNRASSQRQPTPVEDWVNRQLRGHYAWADKRGDLYADAYRSSYILIYLLSAAAVFMALLPMAAQLHHGTVKSTSVAFELVILLLIVLLLWLESTRHWHERWMEYRLLAELIRQVRILIPFGGGRPFPRVPAHLGIYGNLDQTWMYWHMRAISRATGIPNEKITPRYVHDCLDYVGKIVGVGAAGQLQFHHQAERSSHRMRHRLHVASTVLFFLTIVSIATHFALGLPWLHAVEQQYPSIDGWLVLLAATLPALGAALAGIANQGEFARLAKRSAAMAGAFEEFAEQIRALESEAERGEKLLSLARVGQLAAKIAEVMVDEVSDWRVIVVEPPVRA